MGSVIQKIRTMMMRPFLLGWEGASVPAILMSAGVLGVTAVGITSALTQAGKTQNDAAIKASAGKFQEVLRSELAKTAKNFIFDDCTGARYGSTHKPLSQAFKKLTLSSVDGGGSASMSYTTKPSSLASGHKSAAIRCANPRNGAADGARISNGEYMYFCMKFEADTGFLTKENLSNQSFWKLPETFMEVLIIPVQLQSDEPILCRNVNDASQGAKVIYSIYYANKSGGPSRQDASYDGKRIDGVFYVSGDR